LVIWNTKAHLEARTSLLIAPRTSAIAPILQTDREGRSGLVISILRPRRFERREDGLHNEFASASRLSAVRDGSKSVRSTWPSMDTSGTFHPYAIGYLGDGTVARKIIQHLTQ